MIICKYKEEKNKSGTWLNELREVVELCRDSSTEYLMLVQLELLKFWSFLIRVDHGLAKIWAVYIALIDWNCLTCI